jgi:PPOX class probable F420-dependent enzyme
MNLHDALTWASQRKHAVLITLRKDGRAQSSDVVYASNVGGLIVSVTADRAKTVNMQRDDRVVLHITDPASWSYISLSGTAKLSPVATQPDDAICDALVDYYRSVTNTQHNDWPSYRQAMVDEKRLLVTIEPTTVAGQINPSS